MTTLAKNEFDQFDAAQTPQPDLTFVFADWHAPDLDNTARVRRLLEAIVAALKIAPDHELRTVKRGGRRLVPSAELKRLCGMDDTTYSPTYTP
jgi:hypothetical protein